MDKPKRLFKSPLRCSWRSADRAIAQARTRKYVAVDPDNGKKEICEHDHRPSRAEALAAIVPRIQANYQRELERRRS